ncbi:MAG: exodeoxyribonuclease VII large subunit [Alphaproteobacteria bacterium]|nr:exodeoxyribonuclease VII large subunit [Alphaproteobacteria bacterium]
MEEEFTVSRLSALIRRSLETNFGQVKLSAEVSALKVHFSGHTYLSLKDESAVIDAVCWKGVVQKNKLKLENGMKITCYGKVSSFPLQSKYQFIIEKFEAAGQGNLLQILEERKKKLAAEGLFDISHKVAIPKIPKVIGVITSPTGAVIQDIMHRIRQRFPVKILLWPTLVQGSEAAEQIVKAIDGMNNLPEKVRPDVLIVARGGGSFEDLMPFNEESVVRAVFRSRIPIISAVGHETDTTLIDYVSDLRAPTPTAAAEYAVPEKIKLKYDLEKSFLGLNSAVSNFFEKKRLLLRSQKILDIKSMLEERRQRLDLSSERLQRNIREQISSYKIILSKLVIQKPVFKFDMDKIFQILDFSFRMKLNEMRNRLDAACGELENNSYRNILGKGFALVQDKNRKPICSTKDAANYQRLLLTFSDGEFWVKKEAEQINLF